MNTKKHNQRKRKRSEKNLFWLVRSTLIGSQQLELYNRKPYKIDYSYSEISKRYHDGSVWSSYHGMSYPKKDLIDRFPDIDHNSLIPVKLVINRDNPDMLIQRIKSNLFISEGTVKYIKRGKEVMELRCPTRISPKLFPEITEESGIIGVRIDKKEIL